MLLVKGYYHCINNFKEHKNDRDTAKDESNTCIEHSHKRIQLFINAKGCLFNALEICFDHFAIEMFVLHGKTLNFDSQKTSLP